MEVVITEKKPQQPNPELWIDAPEKMEGNAHLKKIPMKKNTFRSSSKSMG